MAAATKRTWYQTMTLITLFTAPKPFTDPHIDTIQRNALKSWLMLGNDVEVVVVGDEIGVADVCKSYQITHLPEVRCNQHGTPLISSIFTLAQDVNDSPILVYCNADIIFLSDFFNTVNKLVALKKPFLGVGQRWDIDVNEPLVFTPDWENLLKLRMTTDGKLHEQSGSDYFIYPRHCFENIPDFAVGRAGWDNWMIFFARWNHWKVVDLTESISAIHQDHDYSHLPGGLKHFFQPETESNVRLAGGRRTIFTMADVTHELLNRTISKKQLNWRTFWRRVETFPLVGLRSRFLGWMAFAVFHPVKAFNEIRGWFAYKITQWRKND